MIRNVAVSLYQTKFHNAKELNERIQFLDMRHCFKMQSVMDDAQLMNLDLEKYLQSRRHC